ncbi:MAG: DUF4159 domain-containing protein [Pacificimonas sp.]
MVRRNAQDALTTAADLYILVDRPVATSEASDWRALAEEGASLVSFAGPRLAENGSAVAPVDLRSGARALGGVMSWESPLTLAPFANDGPLAGLPVDAATTISRQVLTRTGSSADVSIWAQLEDGTPLVTASRVGDGLLILVHTAATPGWSTLPLSGLFEPMLERLTSVSRKPDATDLDASGPWRLDRELTGDGRLVTPDRAVEISDDEWRTARARPETPPGLYQDGDVTRALNLTSILPQNFAYQALQPDGFTLAREASVPIRAGPWLLLLAAALALLDLMIGIDWRRMMARPSPAVSAAIIAACLVIGPAHAQDEFAELQVAYVGGTPNAATIAAGLARLSQVIGERTSVSPGAPAAIDPADPEIGRYPIIYWPASERGTMTSAEARNVTAYLARGGLLLFDFAGGFGEGARRLLGPLGLPSLEELDGDHVLTRSYYILGQPADAAVWVEADTEGDEGRVSGVVIGSGNWAASWAGVRAASPRRRERDLRLGVNLVMYALTGTYKADQVHTETLLDRIGE